MKERSPQDEQWNQQRLQNADHNKAIFEGWRGSTYFRNGAPAGRRILEIISYQLSEIASKGMDGSGSIQFH
jgi:hypothetical protein